MVEGERERPRGPAWLAASRPGHQAKNLLVLLPWLAHHGPFDADHVLRAVWALVSFGLVAASTYLVNDVGDREADLGHPRKRTRPVAAGSLRPSTALGLALGFVLAGLAIAVAFLPGGAWPWLLLYVLLSLAYSLVLKRVALLDVMVLTAFYLLRILFGGAALEIWISPWLLGLTGFLFLSLAFLKRSTELGLRALAEDEALPGRGYRGADRTILEVVGPACGCLAVLVLALYVNSDQVVELYARPEVLWLACPALLYWIVRLWLLAHRGSMIDDPVVFALRDLPSWIVAIWIMGVGMAAAW